MFKEGMAPIKKADGVAVNSTDFPVDAHRCSLLMITPEEQAHAILLKVADDVQQAAKNHKQCRVVLLSVPEFMDVGGKTERLGFNFRKTTHCPAIGHTNAP